MLTQFKILLQTVVGTVILVSYLIDIWYYIYNERKGYGLNNEFYCIFQQNEIFYILMNIIVNTIYNLVTFRCMHFYLFSY